MRVTPLPTCSDITNAPAALIPRWPPIFSGVRQWEKHGLGDRMPEGKPKANGKQRRVLSSIGEFDQAMDERRAGFNESVEFEASPYLEKQLAERESSSDAANKALTRLNSEAPSQPTEQGEVNE
jgi:hypothetical protein